MKVDESQYSDDEEFVENVKRMEVDENSDEGGAEVSFVSNGSTLASSTSHKCGFPGCTTLSAKSREYTMKNGKRVGVQITNGVQNITIMNWLESVNIQLKLLPRTTPR